MKTEDAAFYSVSGRDFFPGVVALVNSLRLQGHEQPVFVLDCGLTGAQRELLAREATVVPAPDVAAPSMQKLVAPLAHPAETMVLLDADMIVTRPLDDLIATAAQGRLVAFENESPRFFPDWGELLGLEEAREGPYLMSSALVLSREVGGLVLPLVAEKQAGLETAATWLADGEEADESAPFFFADQDVLNAVIGARLGADEVVALEARLAAIPPFAGLRCTGTGGLDCAYEDDARPYLIHHFFRKPWLVRMHSNIYSRLLTRLLCEPDVRLRPDPSMLPLRLRTGSRAGLARAVVDLGIGGPAALRRRFGSRPDRIAAWPNG